VTDELRVIDNATARQLMSTLSRRRWSWAPEHLRGFVEGLGWTMDYEDPEGGAKATALFGVKSGNVRIAVDDGEVKSFTIRVTDSQAKKTPESLQFMHDAFTNLVALGTELFGEPTHRITGQNPEVQWRFDESSLTVKNIKVATVIKWNSNAFQDHWNRMAAG
jgi:hypothetical protein